MAGMIHRTEKSLVSLGRQPDFQIIVDPNDLGFRWTRQPQVEFLISHNEKFRAEGRSQFRVNFGKTPLNFNYSVFDHLVLAGSHRDLMP